MNLRKYLLIALLAISLLFILVFFFGIGFDRPPAQHLLLPEESAHPSDGRGRAIVAPAGPVHVLQRDTWTITFIADTTGIAAGGGIVFQISPFWGWSAPQAYSPDRPGYTTVRSDNRGVRFDLQGSSLHYLLINVVEGELSGGDTVTIVYGNTGGGEHPLGAATADRYAERGEKFFLKVDGNGDRFFTPIPIQPAIDVVALDAVKLMARAPSLVSVGETFEVPITALDPLDNWDRSFEGTIEISASGAIDLPHRIPITPADSGLVVVEAEAREAGKFRIRARAADDSIEPGDVSILCTPDRTDFRLYWGDLHGHSGLSDGTGSPDDYFAYARYVSGIDVCALTDHDAHGILPLDESPDLWRRILDAVKRHHAQGRFVIFPGYEWTSWTYGHRHVLFPGDEGEIYSFRQHDSDTPPELWKLLEPWRAIVIPHHPAGGPVPIDWEHHDDRYEPLVEIISAHGNSDADGEPLQIYRSKSGRFVTDALRRGYMLGILASGDTHDGHPGHRSAGAPSMGLAGIWAGSLDRESIWKALLARRTYGTSGARIVLRFRMGDHRMGEVVRLDAPDEIEGEIFVSGTAGIRRVELLEREEVAQTFETTDDPAVIRFRREVTPPTFYRVRVYQEDGEMAWSSPIWFQI
jgi:hypothetical protein